jgi:hypothetical protein
MVIGCFILVGILAIAAIKFVIYAIKVARQNPLLGDINPAKILENIGRSQK